MKEHPIIFSSELIPKILNGEKTMTRRVIKTQPYFDDGLYDQGWIWEGLHHQDEADLKQLILMSGRCPYGQVGDLLWVRETHFRYGRWIKNGFTKTGKQAWAFFPTTDEVLYYDDAPEKLHPHKTREEIARERLSDWYKRPSIFMPRWASRILLTIIAERAEKVLDITSADALLEGYPSVEAYLKEMDRLNGKRGYIVDMNYWVWVISFKLVL